jgi:hypothetical protein
MNSIKINSFDIDKNTNYSTNKYKFLDKGIWENTLVRINNKKNS